MNHEDLDEAYTRFFTSESGKYLLEQIRDAIADCHSHAEDFPEHARDYVQRAKGAKLWLEHIESVMSKPKKVANQKEGAA